MAARPVITPGLDPNDPADVWLDSLDVSHIKPLDDDWEKHPYWADQDDLENDESNLAAAAREMAIEDSPEEKAEDCKNIGNDLVRQGKQRQARQLLREAVDKYTAGLRFLHEANSSDNTLRCVLHSNTAQAHAHLGNWRNSLYVGVGMQSARRALQADGGHFKSFLRAAAAAARLREWTLVRQLCAAGLALEPENPDLLRLDKEAQHEEEERRKREDAQRAAQHERERPFRAVARCLTARGFAMTRPQFGFQKNQGAFLPWLEGADAAAEAAGGGVPAPGALHFPVMLYYPEASPYHDTIEDVCETDTIRDHLEAAFGEGTPAIGWDEEGAYTRPRVRLFYCSHCGTVLREAQITETLQGRFPSGYVETGCQQYGPRTSAMVPVEEEWTFAQLLARPDHVMPGIPVLFVVAAGTAFHDRFLKSFDPNGR